MLLKLSKRKFFFDSDIKHALKNPSVYSYAPKQKPIEKCASKLDRQKLAGFLSDAKFLSA